jgi:hypothetical protein
VKSVFIRKKEVLKFSVNSRASLQVFMDFTFTEQETSEETAVPWRVTIGTGANRRRMGVLRVIKVRDTQETWATLVWMVKNF